VSDLPHKSQESEEKPHPLTSALTFLTYPAAALAAFLVGRTEIRKSIYKNFVTSGAFKDIQSGHRVELNDIMNPAAGTGIVDGPALTKEANHAYRLAVKERFEKIGFKSVMDYWHGLHPNQKIGAIMFAAGTAGIVISTSLAFVNNKSLLEKLNNKDKAQAHEAEASH
jgi:hypothetical protein